MNILVCHSPEDRCGVREYGLSLDRSLIRLGVNVRTCTYRNLIESIREQDDKPILLVHFEPGLIDIAAFLAAIDEAKRRSIKIVFCCHWYDRGYLDYQYAGLADVYVLHREYPNKHENTVIIPLGCPVYEPAASQKELRDHLGLPLDKTVLTTIGFFAAWKRLPELLAALLDAIEPHPRLFVHMHAPHPFNGGDAQHLEPAIFELLMTHQARDRVKYTTTFVPEKEAIDIAHAADIGFLFHPIHTHSVSAATKQFVSARRPQIVTNSSHADDLREGIVRIGTFDPPEFARQAVATALSPMMADVQRGSEREYARMNMDAVAEDYAALFGSLQQ
jgi:glycosyltransferase involved in cell wall biosynthesis